MTMPHNLFNTLQSFSPNPGRAGQFYSLPQLEKEGVGKISRLPVSIRIVLESVLRNFDGQRITEEDVRASAATGFHRRAPARRSRRDAISSRALEQEPRHHRTSGAGRFSY